MHFSLGWGDGTCGEGGTKCTRKKNINQANSQGRWEMKEAKSQVESGEFEIMFIVWFKGKL